MAELSSQRVAWITGAGTGIGRGLARRLAQRGWLVAASARTARDLDSLAAEVPGRITAFQLDVTDEKAALATGERVEEVLGPVDLAILNAGGSFAVSAANFSVANVRRTVDLNLMGEVNCMGPIVPRMIARRRGHIVLMGSLTAYLGLPTAPAYGATKAAINSMAQAFRPDFERFGVTISVVNPGFVETPLTARNTFPMPLMIGVDAAVDRIIAGIDSGRFEISFPWQMSALVRLVATLPNWARFAITRRMLPPG